MEQEKGESVIDVTSGPTNSQWYVYIVQTSRALYYTGISTDVERRFQEHRDMFEGRVNAKGAKYFRGNEPVGIVYREQCASRQLASRREYVIKRMTKAQKRQLVAAHC